MQLVDRSQLGSTIPELNFLTSEFMFLIFGSSDYLTENNINLTVQIEVKQIYCNCLQQIYITNIYFLAESCVAKKSFKKKIKFYDNWHFGDICQVWGKKVNKWITIS